MNSKIAYWVQEEQEEYDFLNSIPLLSGCELKEGEEEIIAAQYRAAMIRRRDYVCDLASHIRRCASSVRIHRYKSSYLVGYEHNGVFIISHFAPSSIREGREMIKRLGMAVAAVTPDLSPMLSRCGWTYGGEIPQMFAGEIHMKEVWVSKLRPEHIRSLLQLFLQQA